MYAHRGMHVNSFDENSMKSFRNALLHMDGFECDVQLSKDNALVIVHDKTLYRTHKINKRVDEMMLCQLKALKIPELCDVIDLMHDNTKTIILD